MNKKLILCSIALFNVHINAESFDFDYFIDERLDDLIKTQNTFENEIYQNKLRNQNEDTKKKSEKEAVRKKYCKDLSYELILWVGLHQAALKYDESPDLTFWLEPKEDNNDNTQKRIRALSVYVLNDKRDYKFSTYIHSDVMKKRVEKLIQNKSLNEKITIREVIDSIKTDLEESSCSVTDTE